MMNGVVKKGRIFLEENFEIPEGTKVTVIVPPKYHLLKCAGKWKKSKNLDKLIEEIYTSRIAKRQNENVSYRH